MTATSCKLILCDLGNVLLNFDHRIAVRRIKRFTDRSSDEIYSLFFDSPLTRNFEEGKLTPPDFFKHIDRELGFKGLDFDGFLPIWNEIFSDHTGMLTLLVCLKKRYPLYLVSNINKLHYEYIANVFPSHLDIFDKIYLSYREGRVKPDRLLYETIIKDSGLEPREIIYTDDRQDLIEASAELGFSAVLFKDTKSFRQTLCRMGVLI